MSAKGTLTVASLIVARRRSQIVVDRGGEHEERLRVVRQDGCTVTVTRWRWWHAAMAMPGVWWRRFRWWLDGRVAAWEDS